MKTRELEFRSKLRDLMEEYKVIIVAGDHYGGYAECGEDIRITIENEVGAPHFGIDFCNVVIDVSSINEMMEA